MQILAQFVTEIARKQWNPCWMITLGDFRCITKRLQLQLIIIWVRNYQNKLPWFFRVRAVSHSVLYYQQFSIAGYQVSFMQTNVYLHFPIVWTSLNFHTLCNELPVVSYFVACQELYRFGGKRYHLIVQQLPVELWQETITTKVHTFRMKHGWDYKVWVGHIFFMTVFILFLLLPFPGRPVLVLIV